MKEKKIIRPKHCVGNSKLIITNRDSENSLNMEISDDYGECGKLCLEFEDVLNLYNYLNNFIKNNKS